MDSSRVPFLRSLVLLAALGGCGYKGPLYLPGTKGQAQKGPTIIVPEAPERPQPAQAVPPPK